MSETTTPPQSRQRRKLARTVQLLLSATRPGPIKRQEPARVRENRPAPAFLER